MKTEIKTLKTLLIAGFITLSLLAVANTTPLVNKNNLATEKTIRDYFKFPQVLIPGYENNKALSQKVEVLFTTDKRGKVNFVLVKTDNNELKKEIEKQFLALRLAKIKEDVVHSVVLNFRTI